MRQALSWFLLLTFTTVITLQNAPLAHAHPLPPGAVPLSVFVTEHPTPNIEQSLGTVPLASEAGSVGGQSLCPTVPLQVNQGSVWGTVPAHGTPKIFLDRFSMIE